MLAFNWFFLEPVHTFTLTDSKNWLALAVFVATAIVVSELAARSRRRAREASLLAEIAGSLLEHGTVGEELERISADAARALQVERRGSCSASGGGRLRADRGRAPRRLDPPGGPRAARRLPRAGGCCRRSPRCSGVAIDREQLEREALEAEALRRADVIKTALLRAVSHDLRTPLMAISTSAGALARRDLAIDDADRAELLATILAASDRLDHLVGNLLDLSRLQAGAAQPEQELWQVEDLVVGALDELGADAGRVEITLPDESPSVRVDAHQIRRVLVNLVENALKYSPADDTIHVQVSATPSEAVVRVIDHGPGVPARGARADLRAVPPRHPQRRRGRRRPRPRDRARLRRGERRPSVRSSRVYGQGATFVLVASRGAGGGARLSAAGPRVLVVDDEQQILRALRTSLRGAGYEVETADTAETALAAAAMRPPDAVILDLVLPDGTGIDVCRELRRWSSAPVILLSAVGEEREKVAALDAGADDYVTKPVGIDELLARLRAVLRRTTPGGEPVIELGELVVDLEKRAVTVVRRAGAPDAAPVRAAPRARRQPRQAAHAPHAPAGGLGAGLRRRVEPPARERLAAPPQDRARPRAPALPADRAGRRLPARRSGRARPLAPSGFLQGGRRDLHAASARPSYEAREDLTELRLPAHGAETPRTRQRPPLLAAPPPGRALRCSRSRPGSGPRSGGRGAVAIA